MKRIFVILLMVGLPLACFSQESKLTHNIDFSTGYSYCGGMSGWGMQIQYGLGVIKHLDVLFALSAHSGVNPNMLDNIGGDNMYLSLGASVGVRTYYDFAKICSARISLLYGGVFRFLAHDCQPPTFNGYLIGYNLQNIDTKAELLFQVSPKTKLGVFYDYSFIFHPQVPIHRTQDIHTAGIVISTKLN